MDRSSPNVTGIDLTPLVQARTHSHRSLGALAGIAGAGLLAAVLLAAHREWLWTLAAGAVSLPALAGLGAVFTRRWRIALATQSFLASAVSAVTGLLLWGAWHATRPGSTGPDPDPSAAAGLILCGLFLAAILMRLVKGARGAAFFFRNPLGIRHEAILQRPPPSRQKPEPPQAPRPWLRSWRALTGIALGLASAASLLAFLRSALAALPDRGDTPFLLTGNPALLWCGVISGALAIHLVRDARRRGAIRARAALQDDPRPPVLFLRSFGDDAVRLRLPLLSGAETRHSFQDLFVSTRGARFEECVTERFARHGPVIAIGRPGEPLPLLGAARDYFADHEWQDAIREWMSRSQRIVMIAGRTEGVGWELGEIHRQGCQDRLLLLFPPEPPAARAARWTAFRNQAASPLLESLGDLDPAGLLAIAFRREPPHRVFSSRHETFWAYDAALTLAIGEA